jgi:hypothetical protein
VTRFIEGVGRFSRLEIRPGHLSINRSTINTDVSCNRSMNFATPPRQRRDMAVPIS